MDVVNILAIGNSFTVDACRYLYQTAAASGIETNVVNLCIGGCSLEQHWRNIESNAISYQYQKNGVSTERSVSVGEALREEKWDYIVTQQVSSDSGWEVTYEPFLGLMVQHLREQAGDAEILLQQTWAYEVDSPHGNFMRYHRDQMEMYAMLSACYKHMAQKYGLRLIPSADIIQRLRATDPFIVQKGGMSLCRDGFHMSLLYGRYALALTWVKTLFGVPVGGNTYIPFDDSQPEEQADPRILDIVRQTVESWNF